MKNNPSAAAAQVNDPSSTEQDPLQRCMFRVPPTNIQRRWRLRKTRNMTVAEYVDKFEELV
ncbi:hypothetical protein PC116_g13139 [Phytophthora cactorum]|uniref:Uncharacterized protein n=1 Tax=Phytophthora cactorum TaxID=29920 RepID=A0A8T1KQT7_9STRA|nr:hypothetical protein PC114_g10538 [Phytophthora cactorum]KAG2954932.1 hypothetical protein PC117_g737 [Phytophthora cactorum]KAG3014937.1 hypothetical protein PC120_g12438 [Phytophthora cactorum]KAG3020371.1 hypothetical protein PC119_g9977 [Phytophthora cactorum]KAG3169147.1 hypothetical protein C6341_g11150 [Phytophthora cactorum]